MQGCKNIIIFSTADWKNPFWTNKQHITVQFEKLGYRILYIESLGLRAPSIKSADLVRILKRLIRFFRGAEKVSSQIWVYSPLVLPFHRFEWVRQFNAAFLKLVLKYLKWKLDLKNCIVWTYNPMVLSLAQSLNPKLIVYHSVDDLTAGPRMPKQEIELAEKQMIVGAKFVFVTSPTLKAKYQAWFPNRTIYYHPNVADREHFSRALDPSVIIPDELLKLPAPRIGFIGAISRYKLDIPMLAEVARLRPDYQFIMIGKVGEGDPDTDVSALTRPNIHLIGPKPYSSLPAYLKGFDCVIIPSPINDYTRSMFPMKFFEYLAAEKTLVSTGLPSIQEFSKAYIECDGSAGHFAECLDKALRGEGVDWSYARQISKANTWENRTQTMIKIVEEARS